MSTITSEIRLRVRADGDKVLVDLGTKLNNLANQTTLSSNNFKGLAEELKKLQQTTVQSAKNIKDYSGAWKELAANVDISSKEFKQATAEADALDARLKTFQGVQTTVATNFRNIASAAKQASAAMQTATGLIRDPLTGAYRGTAGKTQYDAPIGPVAPPDTAGRYAQQQREANAQSIRDARRRETMQQRAVYFGDISGSRDPRTGAIIAGGMGPFQAVGTQYARPIGPELPPPPRRRLNLGGAAQTAGAVAASGVFGGPEGLVGAGIGALGGPGGAAVGGAIGAQVGMLRQAIGETATYASEITKLNIALEGITKTSQEYSNAQNAISSISKSLNVPIKEATSGFTRLSASVIGAGGNVNDAEIVFRGITTAIKATGGGAAEVQGALLAMSQVFSKGKVSAEELSGQLGERLPGAVTAFAKATGRTLPQLQKDLENGVVGLNDVFKFAISLESQYGETAQKVASSSEESGARMTVAFDEVKLAVGSAFQPIGSIFQDSITEMVTDTKGSLKILKEAISAVSKAIEDLIGPQTLKAIKDFANANLDITKELKEGFKDLPLVIAASIDPLTKTFALLVKIAEVAKLLRREPQALGDGRYAAPEQQQETPKAEKPPSNLPGPKGKDDGSDKKAIKDKLDAETQEKINKINKDAAGKQLNNLKHITFYENKISDLQSLQTENNKKESVEKIRQLQSDVLLAQSLNDRIELQRVLETGLAQLVKEDNTRLRLAQRAKLIDDYSLANKKIELKLSQDQNKVLSGRTKDATQQTETAAKELTDSKRLFAVLEDQLAIARATTPEQKIQEESKARINELNRSAVELNEHQQDQAVRLQNTENLKRQILLEQINLKERLAALDPLQQFITQSTTQLENLKGVAVTVSQGIGEALGNSISSGIQGLVEGTANAQQIFSDFLKSIGQILIQEGAKMIATYTAIAIAKSLAGLFGGGSSAIAGGSTYGGAASSSIFSAGTGTAFGGMSIPGFAEGGRPPVGRPSLVGEKGPELFVPSSSGTIIPADATAAMARYQRQGGGSGAGNSSSDAMGDGAAATPVLSMSFETTRFLGQDYVSTDQLQAAMMATEKRAAAAGAKAGAAQITSKLQQSPAYRRQVGLR